MHYCEQEYGYYKMIEVENVLIEAYIAAISIYW